MAHRVRLQFASHSPRRWPWLVVALVALAGAWIDFREASGQAEAARLKALEREARSHVTQPPSDPVVTSLSWPWKQALDAFEGAHPEALTLLSLQAEGRSGLVRVQAEVPQTDVLQAYLEGLAQAGLVAPRLTRQQTRQDEDGPIVTRFTLEAKWHP